MNIHGPDDRPRISPKFIVIAFLALVGLALAFLIAMRELGTQSEKFDGVIINPTDNTVYVEIQKISSDMSHIGNERTVTIWPQSEKRFSIDVSDAAYLRLKCEGGGGDIIVVSPSNEFLVSRNTWTIQGDGSMVRNWEVD